MKNHLFLMWYISKDGVDMMRECEKERGREREID
jgi:hypothetical protein